MTRSRAMAFLGSAVVIPVAALAVAAWGGGCAASAATPQTSGSTVTEPSLYVDAAAPGVRNAS